MVCRNCNKRSVGCHNDCTEYLEFKQMREQGKQLKLLDSNYNEYKSDIVHKNIKKKTS
jgi:hypothetical protein